jgi:hypothetical protein
MVSVRELHPISYNVRRRGRTARGGCAGPDAPAPEVPPAGPGALSQAGEADAGGQSRVSRAVSWAPGGNSAWSSRETMRRPAKS